MAESIYLKSTQAPDAVSIAHTEGELEVYVSDSTVIIRANDDTSLFLTAGRARALAAWLGVYADIADAAAEGGAE